MYNVHTVYTYGKEGRMAHVSDGQGVCVKPSRNGGYATTGPPPPPNSVVAGSEGESCRRPGVAKGPTR
jgi:hypothetical protein